MRKNCCRVKIKGGIMATVNFAQKYGKETLAAYPIYTEDNMVNKYLIENKIAKPI